MLSIITLPVFDSGIHSCDGPSLKRSALLLSNANTHIVSCAVYETCDPAHNSHAIDLTFTLVPVSLHWEKHSKQRGCWVLDTAVGFSQAVSEDI